MACALIESSLSLAIRLRFDFGDFFFDASLICAVSMSVWNQSLKWFGSCDTTATPD